MNLRKEYSKIETKLNRLQIQKAYLQSRKSDQRKARTRTLIQMGGLLELTPLPSACNIKLGDDLQLDYPDKATTLLGILFEFSNKLSAPISDIDFAEFKKIGASLLKKS